MFRPWMKQHIMRDADTGGGSAGTTAPPQTQGQQAPPDQGQTPPAQPSQGFDWKAHNLSPDLALLVEQRQWKGPADAINSYKNLESLVGLPPDRLLKLPGEKSAPEEWGQVWDRLGRPKDANGYQIPLPEGDKGDFAKSMAPIFHEAGLTQGQVKVLAEKANAMTAAKVKADTDAAKAAHDKEVKELTDEWGALYQTNAEIVDKAAAAFGVTPEHVNALKQVLGPKATMQFFFNIGTKIAVEGQFVGGEKAGSFSAPGGDRTPEMARAEIKQLQNSREFMQEWNSLDPTVRGAARARMERLNQQAYPGVSTFA